MSSRSRSWRPAALVVVVLAATVLFLYFTRDDGSVEARRGRVERTSLVSSLTTNGKMEPSDPYELRAAAPGQVVRMAVKEGDRARRGQPLVELETAEAAAEAARAEAELRDAETALENMERGATAAEAHELDSQLAKTRAERDEAARQLGVSERLVKAGATPRIEAEQARERLRKAEQDLAYLEQRRARRYSAADLETARGRTKQARAALDLARQRLAAATVIAPADGVVYSLPVRRGHFVQRGDLLARVGNLDRMRVRVYVDEPELGRLAKDQEVAVTWDAQPGASWKGRVERLPSEVQALGTRNVGLVECTIANDGRLLPNINVNVEIITQRTEAALTAPKEAVFTEPGAAGKPEQRYVYVVEGGRLQRRNVATGASTPSRIEIRSGLEESQVVVVPLEQKLAAGLRVRFRAEEP